MLRLLRQNADEIGLVMRLNAQHASMVRTSPSVQARLMRMQALRQKREAIDGAANEDAWALHIAHRSMLGVDADAAPQEAAPVEAPATCVDQRTPENVSENGMDSHDAAFETWLSAQFHARCSGRPDGSRLHEVIRDLKQPDQTSVLGK